MSEHLNLIDMVKKFGEFFKKNTTKILLLFLVVCIVFGGLYYASKPFYNYELTLSSKQLSNGDLNLMIEKMGRFVEEEDPSIWSDSFQKESTEVIRDLGVIKKYGNEHSNSILTVNLFDTSKAELVQEEILSYLNKSPEVVRINDKNEEHIQKMLDLNSQIIDSSLDPSGLNEYMDSLKNEISEGIAFTLLSQFETGNRKQAGPELSKYIEWGSFSFIAICAIFFGLYIYKK